MSLARMHSNGLFDTTVVTVTVTGEGELSLLLLLLESSCFSCCDCDEINVSIARVQLLVPTTIRDFAILAMINFFPSASCRGSCRGSCTVNVNDEVDDDDDVDLIILRRLDET